ncbi:MAG: alpha-glucan family phosphorylase [Bacteroidia bacterium]
MIDIKKIFPYEIADKYSKPVAYFSMEFAIDQTLKIYSGGLGFLAGSHLRSAYELKQNFVGIGILWKYGYYDQERNKDGTMKVSFIEKNYSFLTDTGITFDISVNNYPVKVKAWMLNPEIFKTAPLFLLSTDLPENDFMSQAICHRLYDFNEPARIAQSILLGTGGGKLLDILNRNTEAYHLNEGHGLPLCFYLLDKYKSLEEVRRRVVFTTHTPEKAGNEQRTIAGLEIMSFFNNADKDVVKNLAAPDKQNFNYTLGTLRMSRIANGVSKMHGEVSRNMWSHYDDICPIIHITNAQNRSFWMDAEIAKHYEEGNDYGLAQRKKAMKRELFHVVADQTGKRFDENVLTIVWARRFAAYKRANLLLRDFGRFMKIINNAKFPVQVIWAGKPYPEDEEAINIFNNIYWQIKQLPNCAILTGHEMHLSGLLKKGSDLWLNTPRIFHEAAGTSGMTAAMNGSINLSIPDGWVPEFAKNGENCFLISAASASANAEEQDNTESNNLYNLLEKDVIPTYYQQPELWHKIIRQAINDISIDFNSNRMAREYYELLYLDTGKSRSEQKVLAGKAFN